MEHYLFLSSNDSTVHYPRNWAGDFTVTLPKTYHLNGHWECALLELIVRSPRHQKLLVCCDVIEDSCVRDILYPVLRIVPPEDKDHFTFERPYFFPIRNKEINQIRLFIRGSDLQPLPSDSSSIDCVLLLRRKRWAP